jgi:hypothetical protein
MNMIETRFVGYLAGDDGRIYSTIYNRGINREPRALAFGRGSSNYQHVNIRITKGEYKTTLVHSFICEAFNGPRPDGYVCSHLDGNLDNNVPSNLMWETQADNLARKKQHGTDDCGHRNSRSKLTQQQVKEIRQKLAAGKKHKSIADEYNVSRTVVTRINSGTRYAR